MPNSDRQKTKIQAAVDDKGRRALAIQQEQFSGPLPHPETLQHYENIQPGFADRIIKMAESEQAHRHDCEKRALDAEISDGTADRLEAMRGQNFALLIGVVGFAVSAWAAYCGQQIVGAVVGGTSILSLVGAFLAGRKKDTSPPPPILTKRV